MYISNVYMMPAEDIPLVRRRVADVVRHMGFLPDGHPAKTLVVILEQYLRDELFQMGVETLHDITLGILQLQERQRMHLLTWCDLFGRLVSYLVFVPREKSDTDLRAHVQGPPQAMYRSTAVEFTPQLSESVLACIYITVRTQPDNVPEVDVVKLEDHVVRAARHWQDDLADALLERGGGERDNRLLHRYVSAFPADSRGDYVARLAVRDIELMKPLLAANATDNLLTMQFHRPLETPSGALRPEIYRAGQPISLSHSLPVLEHLGVRINEKRPCYIEPAGAVPIWIYDFGIETIDDSEVDLDETRTRLEGAFACIWSGELEDDDLSRLVLQAGLAWHKMRIPYAYACYIRQIGSTFSGAYMENALNGNPSIAQALVRLFLMRFDLMLAEAERSRVNETLREQIDEVFEDVPNLDEDRIPRQFPGVLEATLRMNCFQNLPDMAHGHGKGQPEPCLPFKFSPARVPGLPGPKLMFGIWMYSSRVEGVHLRDGKIVRSGLCWSDWRKDFHTEVLGLVKAQMVKNTVIVPIGPKGDFVVKQPPPATDRDVYLAKGMACYQTFLYRLLNLIGNYADDHVMPPRDVIRYDENDPHLVAAADKDTAMFSDYTDAIPAEYGFWLGDASTSGGSIGCDHKKVVITARGAWESVKCHFSEIGVDTQT